MTNLSKSKAILVLGMHRSGTSALTRVLNLCGVALSDNLLPPNDDNKKGFWEHKDIVKIQEDLLLSLGSRWDNPRPLPSDWLTQDVTKKAMAQITEILQKDFEGEALWGVKDPRLCRLVPMWQKILKSLKVETHYVFAYRSPEEVAKSLGKRDKFLAGRSLLLWLMYNLEAILAVKSASSSVLSYDHFLEDPIASSDKIAKDLGLKWSVKKADLKKQVAEFIDLSQRHHKVDKPSDEIQKLVTDFVTLLEKAEKDGLSSIVKKCQKLYADVCDVVTLFMDVEEESLKHQQNVIHAEMLDVIRKSEEADALKSENKRLQKELQAKNKVISLFENSFSFRITKPLRYLAQRVRDFTLYLPRGFHQMNLVPNDQIEVHGDKFKSISSDPFFILQSDQGKMPRGWVKLCFDLETGLDYNAVEILVDQGAGYSAALMVKLPPRQDGAQKHLIRLPSRVAGLRFDPMNCAGEFEVKNVTFKEHSTFAVFGFFVWNRLKPLIKHPSLILDALPRLWAVYRQYGLRGIRNRLAEGELRVGGGTTYAHWVKLFDTLSDRDRNDIKSRMEELAYQPLISVVMPTYNPPIKFLEMAIESVQKQLYTNWEFCIADDASTDPKVRACLEKYAANDERIKVHFREENGHISASSNSALDLATGEFVALLDHDDELTEHALYMVAEALNQNKDLDVIFSDEDKINEQGTRHGPHFKPGWNRALFYCQNYVSHLGVYRTSILKDIGGFRLGYEGSQDYDLALRAIEKTTDERIHHIPHILYHWRAISGSTALCIDEKSYAVEAGRKALKSHLDRIGVKADVVPSEISMHHRAVYELPKKLPLISVIIPTRDQVEVLKTCVDGLLHKTDYDNLEVIIMDNGSEAPETMAYFAELKKDKRVQVIRHDAPFNYSELNNIAAKKAKGDYYLLLNNDIEPINREWLTEMLRQMIFEDVGIVGAKLYYPNKTLQHAGVVMSTIGIADHLFRFLTPDDFGYFARTKMSQEFMAVTAACMLVKKSVFEELNGLDEENLAVAFNDVDFCLRAYEAGYRIVYTPFANLTHHESLSRGAEEGLDKVKRFKRETTYIWNRWKDFIENDPYLNPNFILESHNYALSFPTRAPKPWKNKKGE